MNRAVRRIVTGMLAVSVALLLLGAVASAASIQHRYEGSFFGGPPGASPKLLLGLAFDNSGGPSHGALYVAALDVSVQNSTFSHIYKFDEDGSFAGMEVDGGDTPEASISLLGGGLRYAYGGLAVDSSQGANKGNFYVADPGHGVVHRFDETGKYLCQITGVPIPSKSECAGSLGSQTPAGSMLPTSLVVDESSGDLYVSDDRHRVINKFDESGKYIGQISDPHIGAPNFLGFHGIVGPMALDSGGALYLANIDTYGGREVIKFDASGTFVSTIENDFSSSVAIDRSSGHLYIAHGGIFRPTRDITDYDEADTPTHNFGVGPTGFGTYGAMGVHPDTGKIYAAAGSSIDIFSPDTVVPDVTADPASDIGETTVSLSGAVSPAGGDVTSCQFEYGTTKSYGSSSPCHPAVPFSMGTSVSADPEDLDPSTTYHFRLAASNDGVSPYSKGLDGYSDGTFITKGPPTVGEQNAVGIERTTATLRAMVNPHGFATDVKFEYVPEESFDQEGGFSSPATRSTTFSHVGAGLEPQLVELPIQDLQVGAKYRFRAVANSPRGTTLGPAAFFTTTPAAAIGRQWVYARVKSAILEAKIDPTGFETTCHMQYVSDADFEVSGYTRALEAPCHEDPGSGFGEKIVKTEIDGLEIDTTYHFRFVGINETGVVKGKDQTFATFGFKSFKVEVIDENGEPFTQAGGHPYATVTTYELNHTFVLQSNKEAGALNGYLRDLISDSPPGRVTDTDATPRCPGYVADEERCSADTQVGRMYVEYFRGLNYENESKPIYNVVPPEGTLSRYSTFDPYSKSDGSVKTGSEYEVSSGTFDLGEEARIVKVIVTIWGVPSDPSHNPDRRCPGKGDGCASGSPRVPLIRNPTSCDGMPQLNTAEVNSWQYPDEFSKATSETPPITGCELLEFDPSIEFQPTTNVADTPTGLRFNIHVPQNEDPDGISVADLRNTLFEPPEGLVINPSVAHGLVGCTSEQVGMDSEDPGRCPDASKIGRAEINTPLLDHRLHGSIHIAEPYDNEFNSLFAIYITVHDPESGVVIKLSGEIQADGQVGQLTSSFSDNPQLSFEDFTLEFFGGPRAVLRTPPTCGTYTTHATLTPWSAPDSGPPIKTSDSFQITAGPNGGPCAAKDIDAPSRAMFRAGTITPIAGAYTPFVVHLRREDGTQQFGNLTVDPPPGLLGRLAGRSYCSDSALTAAEARPGLDEQADPSCPAGAQIGTVTVGAGAGPAPYYVKGKAYLAEPYRGAPLSLAFVVPALGGPYDLGTIVIRSALQVDLETGRLAAKSEAIPRILEGVSLNVRSIDLRFDQPNFMINPTNCEPMAVSGVLTSIAGISQQLRNPFQVGNCGRLSFAPKLGLRLFGKTHHRAHPGLRAVLRMPVGGANIGRTAVSLPLSLFLDNNRIRGICTREQFASESCPGDSVYGYAKAWSPLLDKPLQGPIRMRSSSERLPNLVADLNGQFKIAVGSQVGSGASGGIKADVSGVPDVPVSKFILWMRGGPTGLLQNSENLCDKRQRASVEFEGHNGKVKVLRVGMKPNCSGGSGKGSNHKRGISGKGGAS